jgi:hypothetical protein
MDWPVATTKDKAHRALEAASAIRGVVQTDFLVTALFSARILAILPTFTFALQVSPFSLQPSAFSLSLILKLSSGNVPSKPATTGAAVSFHP